MTHDPLPDETTCTICGRPTDDFEAEMLGVEQDDLFFIVILCRECVVTTRIANGGKA